MAWYDYAAITFVALMALGGWYALRGMAMMDRLEDDLRD